MPWFRGARRRAGGGRTGCVEPEVRSRDTWPPIGSRRGPDRGLLCTRGDATGQPVSFNAQPPALASVGMAGGRERAASAGARRLPRDRVLPASGRGRTHPPRPHRVEAEPPGEGGPFTEPGVRFALSSLRHGFCRRRCSLACCRRAAVRVGASCPAPWRALATVSDSARRDSPTWCTRTTAWAGSSGFDTEEVAGVVRDYLYIELKGEDRLSGPHDQLAKVSRTRSRPAARRLLSELGGKAWPTSRPGARVGARAGWATARLYARRQHVDQGPDQSESEWMARLEEGFPFEETDDQRTAIDIVFEELIRPADGSAVCRGRRLRPDPRSPCGPRSRRRPPDARCCCCADHDLLASNTRPPSGIAFATTRSGSRGVAVGSARRGQEGAAEYAEGKVDVLIGTHRCSPRRRAPEPRLGCGGRGTALWRRSEGAAAPAAAGGGRAGDVGHAHPPHAAHGAYRDFATSR